MEWLVGSLLVGAAALLLLGTPVAVVLGLASSLYILLGTSIPGGIVPQALTSGANSFSLLAIPFFLLAGTLMNSAGITNRLFDFAGCLVRHLRGGLGHVNVMASMIFSGMSGSAVADAAGLGVVEIKAMREAGYDAKFAAAITAASSTIGPIIPPSIIFVIYGVLAEVSIGALFLAGIVPGILMGLALSVQIYLTARRRDYPVHPRATAGELGRSFVAAFPPLLTPVIIIGGMMAGIFTPTEASVVAVAYAVLLGLVYRELSWSSLVTAVREVAVQTATIMFITATASLLGWVLARAQVPQTMAIALLALSENPLVILLLINVLLLAVGCFMEVIASLLILTPILVPIVKAIGVDPVHFGVVMTLNLMIGLLTPPMGMGLFVVQKISGVPFDELVKALLPFHLALLVVLAIVVLVPELSLSVPGYFLAR